jgi:hypothetical protein
MSKEEYSEWYESVDFIQDNMQIYSFADFVDNCFIIKALYSQMRRQGQKLYQWYIFASSLSYKQKQIIWNYLNEWIDYQKLKELAGVDKYNKYYVNMIEQRNDDE